MDFPSETELTWCTEHNIAFLSDECPLCIIYADSCILRITDLDAGVTISNGTFVFEE